MNHFEKTLYNRIGEKMSILNRIKNVGSGVLGEIKNKFSAGEASSTFYVISALCLADGEFQEEERRAVTTTLSQDNVLKPHRDKFEGIFSEVQGSIRSGENTLAGLLRQKLEGRNDETIRSCVSKAINIVTQKNNTGVLTTGTGLDDSEKRILFVILHATGKQFLISEMGITLEQIKKIPCKFLPAYI